MGLTVRGEELYRNDFNDKGGLQKWTADTRYKMQYQDSSSQILLDFQNSKSDESFRSDNLTLSTLENLFGGARAYHLIWQDCSGSDNGDNCWAEYAMPASVKGNASMLVMDVANGSGFDVDFTVEVTLTDGSRSRASIGGHRMLEERYSRSLRKLDYFLSIETHEVVFETVFIDIGQGSEIEAVTLIFDKTVSGEIYVDNIGFL